MNHLFNTNPQSWSGPGFQEGQGANDYSTPPSSPQRSPRRSPPRAPTLRRTRTADNYHNMSPMRLNLDEDIPLPSHVPFEIPQRQVQTYIHRFYTEDNKNCTICYNELNNGQDTCMIPQCGHIFHCECVNEWFDTRLPNQRPSTLPTCPMCRTKTHKDDLIHVDLPPTPSSSFGKKRINSELKYLLSFK